MTKSGKTGNVSFSLTGDKIIIDWGDGTPTETKGNLVLGACSRTYSGGVHTIIIYGENITALYCHGQELSELNINACPSLVYLYADNNDLTVLNVSANPALIDIYCLGNKLQSIDVSANTMLKQLYLYGNLLTNLVVSANAELIYLSVADNAMQPAALNTLFGSLHNHSSPGTGKIEIGGNPGFIDCNKDLIPSGWVWCEYDIDDD